MDITDRKRVEGAINEAKVAAEAASEAKSRFLANISHELRTPMNAILGMVDLALPRQADPIAKDFLQTARESADLLLVLLNDLLDSAKIEAGKVELELAPFSLHRLLDQIAQGALGAGKRKGDLLLMSRFARSAGRPGWRPSAPSASPSQSGRKRRQVHRARRGRGECSS